MRRYETMVIVDPDVAEPDRTGLLDRLGEMIAGHSGYLVERNEWGTRKLAYEIRKKPRGHYTRLDFCGTGELVRELERNLRIDDRFLKYMTVQLEDEVDVEALKEEAARKEAEEAERKAAEKAAAEEREAAAKEAAAAESEPAAEAAPPEAAPAPSATNDAEPETETAAPEAGGDSEVKEGA